MNLFTLRRMRVTLQSCMLLLCFFKPFSSFAQPDYDFRNATLLSGTALQVNAVYLFQDVKPGVDATVTIKDLTGGIFLSSMDSPFSGYVEALQPVLQVPAFSSGYAEFEVNFFIAGTSIPMIQTEIPATPIDVDGALYTDGPVNEFDIVQLTNGYVDYDMLGGELSMNINSPWVTGTNVLTVDYPGVDTAPRQVMFTTVNAALSSFTFRSGATSFSGSERQRLRSIYFKKFQYPNSFLPAPALASFNGHLFNDKINLNWRIAGGSNIVSATVERAGTDGIFSALITLPLKADANSANYDFVDHVFVPGTYYYRLKLTGADGKTQYSQSLLFRKDNKSGSKLSIITVAGNRFTAHFSSDKNDMGTMRVVDLDGRIMYQQKIMLQQGQNNILLPALNGLTKAGYILSLETAGAVHTQKFVIQ
jgi:hypothetical protein